MTRVEFYFNVSSKFAKTVELCEKALAKGRQLTIYTQNDAMSSEMQNLLWTHSSSSFLANSHVSEAHSQFSPIVIDAQGENLLQDDVLINLQTAQPLFFSRFRYLVELVGSDEADKAAARARFRFYKDRGYDVKSTDAAAV
ncbi:DNA polymerase III subunit chi [Methylotenera sp.]|uniref:DNA polymerase III subunit chi n=1 Tax=Methylotenera sp. TaxID=2051956 RepID=UPI002487F423|nr:DNA polymerase III subunit chi [Methylotenera sp.]MDI1297575.1 DNA polymerase III subunit chi [Methylotenera sp.]